MERRSRFSYQCNQCGRCCHDQVISLAPYDVLRLARAAGLSTGEAVAKYTIRRGSILKFNQDGACTALDGTKCTVHSGQPLACRLYPLGLEYSEKGAESYLRLEPVERSRGIYGEDGTVSSFLSAQDTESYLQMNRRYTSLLPAFRRRIHQLADFDVIEPREFWRVAIREALAETNFDFNPIVAVLFAPDSIGNREDPEVDQVNGHIRYIEQQIHGEHDPTILAVAAILLAVSLGYSPNVVILSEHGAYKSISLP